MLKRIIVTGACVLAVMGAIKDGHVLRATGLTATCTVAEHYSDGSMLAACRPGKLEGMPNLARRGCAAAGVRGTLEYWHCPADEATH